MTKPTSARVSGGIACLLAAAFNSASATGGEAYLCISEQATGFDYNMKSKTWGPQTFTAGKKYILKKAQDTSLSPGVEKGQWALWNFGEDRPDAGCYWYHTELMLCDDGPARQFAFSPKTLTFRRNVTYSYFWEDDLTLGGKKIKDRDSIYLEIGSCSPL